MAFKIVRKPSGYPRFPYGAPTGLLRPTTGCLRPVCSRTVSRKRRENWEQLAQHTGARTTSKNSPGALENRRAPYGELRVPHGNGQNYCFYSPYGALNGYVTAACLYICMCIYIMYICVYAYVYVRVCMYIFVCVSAYVYIYV